MEVRQPNGQTSDLVYVILLNILTRPLSPLLFKVTVFVLMDFIFVCLCSMEKIPLESRFRSLQHWISRETLNTLPYIDHTPHE